MAKIDQHKYVDDIQLEHALINLIDELAEFVSVNAFLVNSMASLISVDEIGSREVVEGARYCSDASQARALEIKASLNLILRTYQRGGREKQAKNSARDQADRSGKV